MEITLATAAPAKPAPVDTARKYTQEAADYHAATVDALDVRDWEAAGEHANAARLTMRSVARAVREADAAGDAGAALYCRAMFSAARASADAAEAAIAWTQWRDADDKARRARVAASAASAYADALLEAAKGASKRATVQRQRAADAAAEVQAAQYDADAAAQAAADAL